MTLAISDSAFKSAIRRPCVHFGRAGERSRDGARDLVHSELRHHPDHIVVGDVRRGDYGPEPLSGSACSREDPSRH